MEIFHDREDAGRRLAALLEPYRSEHPLVLGLPRGGVVVAKEIARQLEAPLDVLVVRKLPAPQQPELGLGAIAELDAIFIDPRVVEAAGVTEAEALGIAAREHAAFSQRIALYRRGRPFPDVEGRTVIVADDGIATGGTMRAAIRTLRTARAGRVVVAAPIAAADTALALELEADDVVCLRRATQLWSIGQRYLDFREVSDGEVVAALDAARNAVRIPAGDLMLPGTLHLPVAPIGVVIATSHERLHAAGLATLQVELMGPSDVESLCERLLAVTDWAQENDALRGLPIGYFAHGVTAAAALVAAARRPDIAAVVSRAGRPDLAAGALEHVRASTLLIAGEDSLNFNDKALRRLRCERRLVLVSAPEEATALAIAWFQKRFGATASDTAGLPQP